MISAKKVKELALDLFKVGCCLIIEALKRTNDKIYMYVCIFIFFWIKNNSMIKIDIFEQCKNQLCSIFISLS